jgi:putative tricarboxylic transport membrane protein
MNRVTGWRGVFAQCRGPLAAAATLGLLGAAQAQGWQPTQPVELVVPAGTGGGADQMARLIQKLVAEHRLMPQPVQVSNKPGDSGVEGLLYMKAARGDAHKLVITLSNLFTAPLASGADVGWRDLTPVQMLAQDQFVLWVHAQAPQRSAADMLARLRSAPPGSLKLGGTGSRQEDQLISVLLETAAATRIAYVPLKGGGDVAKALAAREVDMTVNNPIEAEALWRQGVLRPLCVFDGKPLAQRTVVAGGQAWADLPTCMSAGVPVQYLMMRGIFAAPGLTPVQRAYYDGVLGRLQALPEWQAFMARGAFSVTVMKGAAFEAWLDKTERFHRVLMREARFKAPAVPGPAPVSAVAASAPKK